VKCPACGSTRDARTVIWMGFPIAVYCEACQRAHPTCTECESTRVGWAPTEKGQKQTELQCHSCQKTFLPPEFAQVQNVFEVRPSGSNKPVKSFPIWLPKDEEEKRFLLQLTEALPGWAASFSEWIHQPQHRTDTEDQYIAASVPQALVVPRLLKLRQDLADSILASLPADLSIYLADVKRNSPTKEKEADIRQALSTHFGIDGGEFWHSLDYRSVWVRGEVFSLSAQEALIIKELHDASGQMFDGVDLVALSEASGSRQNIVKLRNLLTRRNRSRILKHLIESSPHTKGSYRLKI